MTRCGFREGFKVVVVEVRICGILGMFFSPYRPVIRGRGSGTQEETNERGSVMRHALLRVRSDDDRVITWIRSRAAVSELCRVRSIKDRR